MAASEFVRRMKESVDEPDRHYVLWLGAGCSVTSGIPAAGTLVREHWLPRLHRLRGAKESVEEWAAKALPDYRPDDPAAFYGPLMEVLFVGNAEERQRETERLCDGRVPGFGYAVLAALMSRMDGALSTVLTTNFDDLVADAMYVFGERRPLVIQHESLVGFARSGRVRRPLVVKLHGDHRLNPMHTADETAELKSGVAAGVGRILHDRGVIFIGYSGNDKGVIETLQALPDDALPLGVWWIARREPQGAIHEWLRSRKAVWVKTDGFDELMLLFRDEFGIEHPTAEKFERMVSAYRETYEKLSSAVGDLPDSDVDSAPLKAAARRATEAAPDWWGVELDARRFKETEPARADEIYRAGIERLDSPPLLVNYANFLTYVLRAHDRAEQMYQRAIARAPDNGAHLGAYAVFLKNVRGDRTGAQTMYERALAADPDNAVNIANYGLFVAHMLKQPERARALYKRALVDHPNEAGLLSNYAMLLTEQGSDDDEYARELFARAIEADPADANARGKFARVLLERGDDDETAFALVERSLEQASKSVWDMALRAELWFYLLAVGPPEGRAGALAALAAIVRPGVYSRGWDFSGILRRARAEGHPDIDWLEKLAAVISEGRDAATLEAWRDWPDA